MTEEDHNDLKSMMDNVKNKDIPENMKLLWEQQATIMSTASKTQYRWHPRIMKMCIELYSKNPHVLDPIRKVLLLPSNRTIRCYKNKVDQAPGWNDNLLQWCLEEAKKANLRKEDYWGAFVLDEMKIQEDIQMVIKGGKHRLVGFVDPGKVHDDMEVLSGRFYVMYL
ncbi:uncharacterized protein LOC110248873 [Exaiptasia diaphana]|uniref:Uncharacterized protein n=1 Tax=Exaiptasia diaphana TaxID=2652724 RepID=A0A913XY54_EXADI|nr:uncharacterized protein LOC110248873 [Exaiptasia diaphana]